MCYLTWKFQWNHISLPSSPKKIKHYIPVTWQCRQTAQQTALPAHPLLGTLSTFPSTEWELADYIPVLPTASKSSREALQGSAIIPSVVVYTVGSRTARLHRRTVSKHTKQLALLKTPTRLLQSVKTNNSL